LFGEVVLTIVVALAFPRCTAMKGSVHIQKIMQTLDRHFPPPLPIPLNHGNAFQFLVAVVLSAQTTDGAVNNATKTLFEKARNPREMVQLGQSEIYDTIASLGLAKNKSKYVFGLSQKLSENALYLDGSSVPASKEELTALPGVGDKTASVVLSQIYAVPNLAVDTHVHRLALRWGLSKEKTDVKRVKQDLENLFPEETWNKVHLQMIYFGREFCSAKSHDSRCCPICSFVVHGAEVAEKEVVRSSPSKGIVFYDQRLSELKSSPNLTSASGVCNSPSNPKRLLNVEEEFGDEANPRPRRKKRS